MNIEPLLEPVSEDDPVGPDSFDLPGRDAVSSVFERDEGEVAASEWPAVVKQVVELATETRDLWVAVKMMEAGARAGSLDTVGGGAQLLAGLVEGYWPDVHPKLEDYGFEARANSCASLTKIRDFLGPLRRMTIFETRLGRFSADDLDRFSREGDGADGYGLFRASLDQLRGQGQLEAIAQDVVDQFDLMRDSIRRADAVLTANAGSETSTNFQPTYEAIDAIRRLVAPYAGMPDEPDNEVESDAAGGPVPGNAPAGGRIGGRVDSREDVIKALDAISDYYRTREPASPVPVILKRARQWVTMDFMGVIADLLPSSVEEARNLLVSKQDQQDEENSGY